MAMIEKELINRFKEINMKIFLEDIEGFTFTKEGIYYRCREHDSLLLKEHGQNWHYFWNSKSQYGDIINYVKNNICNGDFREAISYILDKECVYNIYPKKQKDFYNVNREKSKEQKIKVEYNDNPKRTYAYLIKQRYLNKKIINEMIKKGLIKEDKKHNIVFHNIDFENNIVGAELVGTATYTQKHYRGMVHGSNENYGFSLKIGNSVKSLIVFEATIDLLSYYQIHASKLRNCLLLSLNGCEKIRKIKTYTDYYTINTIIVALDNDVAGNEAFNNIKRKYSEFKILDGREVLLKNRAKDFNDLLKIKKLIA